MMCEDLNTVPHSSNLNFRVRLWTLMWSFHLFLLITGMDFNVPSLFFSFKGCWSISKSD